MRKYRGGFTLVEVMIFLAMTGFMFTSAVLIFRGQQSSTEFKQSVRQLESKLSDITNDTASGVFPELNGIECGYNAGGGITFRDNSSATAGSNNNCVFLGKVIQFGDGNYEDGPDKNYNVHTLVGDNKRLIDPNPVTAANSFEGASPHALYGSTGTITFDTMESLSVPFGSKIKRAFYRDSAGSVHYVRGAGVLYSQFGRQESGDVFVSGNASVSLYAVKIPGTASTNVNNSRLSADDFRKFISKQVSGTFVAMSDSSINSPIIICIEGSNNQQTTLELGNSKGSISVRTNFDEVAECL